MRLGADSTPEFASSPAAPAAAAVRAFSGVESAREAVRGAVDDDPVGESPLEKPLEPAGRLGERDGVFGESGREMEGLSRKQDTKSFEVCVRHVTVDL